MMTREIIAKRGQIILVDDADYDELNGFAWGVNITGHAVRRIRCSDTKDGRRWIGMHRQIMGLPAGTRGRDGHVEVDHINGDRLDNQRCNLRLCTRRENNINRRGSSRTGFKGVTLQRQTGLFCAEIRVGQIRKHLGSYKTAEEAHEVYCLWADMLHGEFANHKHEKQVEIRKQTVIKAQIIESRISLSDAEQIRNLRGEFSAKDLAERYGIAASYVYAIWSGKARANHPRKAQ